MASLMRSIKGLRNNTNLPTLPKDREGENTYQLILCGQCYPETKIRQRHYQKRTQTNAHQEYRIKNTQNNNSKPNPATNKYCTP